jgi:hypothetical protein
MPGFAILGWQPVFCIRFKFKLRCSSNSLRSLRRMAGRSEEDVCLAMIAGALNGEGCTEKETHFGPSALWMRGAIYIFGTKIHESGELSRERIKFTSALLIV